MLLVVGLGNPGRQYSANRHNVGFMVVDELATACRADGFRSKFNGEYAKGALSGEDIVLLKPQTFMNESGRSLQAAIAFFKPAIDRVLVIHDELDLPFGTIRLKVGGGHAGHNGLRSIMACIGSGDFGRVRFGIGRPPAGFRGEVADYVLSNFDGSERAELPDLLKKAGDTVLEVASRGLATAMNVHNVRPKPAKKASKAPETATGNASPEAAATPASAEPRADKRILH
ncbi:MAG: aminoacyl-tRNA hydrolase [Polyangiaceae bacterium]